MQILETLDSNRFTLNGISYLRRFFSSVIGDRIRIYNAYDSCNVILDYIKYDQISVDGTVFANVADTQQALSSMLFDAGNVVTQLEDVILFMPPISIAGNVVTIPANARWRIQGVVYTNLLPWTVTIPNASPDNFRIDLIVANTNNTFQLKQGVESESNPAEPEKPFGTVRVTAVNVFGDDTSVAPPIAGGEFVKKITKGENASMNYTIGDEMLGLQKGLKYIFRNDDITYIRGFSASPDDEVSGELYDGAELIFLNVSDVTVNVEHNNPEAFIKFTMLSEVNVLLQPNNFARFIYDKVTASFIYLGGNVVPTWAQVLQAGNSVSGVNGSVIIDIDGSLVEFTMGDATSYSDFLLDNVTASLYSKNGNRYAQTVNSAGVHNTVQSSDDGTKITNVGFNLPVVNAVLKYPAPTVTGTYTIGLKEDSHNREVIDITGFYQLVANNKFQTLRLVGGGGDIALQLNNLGLNKGDEVEIYNYNTDNVYLSVFDIANDNINYRGTVITGDNAGVITIPKYSKAWLRCYGANSYYLVMVNVADVPNIDDVLGAGNEAVDKVQKFSSASTNSELVMNNTGMQLSDPDNFNENRFISGEISVNGTDTGEGVAVTKNAITRALGELASVLKWLDPTGYGTVQIKDVGDNTKTLAFTDDVPTALSQLGGDSTHRVVTDAQIASWNATVGGSIFQTVWNANTNSPALVSSVGTKGYYYIVTTAGATNLNGITDWKVGDWAIYDGTVWRKVDNTDAVASVNGLTGAVLLDTSNVPDTIDKRYMTQAERTKLANTSNTNSGDETASSIGLIIAGAGNATPSNTDFIATSDGTTTKKLTWTNAKAFLKTYFDTLYQNALTAVNFGAFSSGLTAKAVLVDADTMNVSDSADSGNAKKSTLANVYSYLKAKFDLVYLQWAVYSLSGIDVSEDFIANSLKVYDGNSSGGGSATSGVQLAGTVGNLQLQTGTSATGQGGVLLGQGNSGTFNLGEGLISHEIIVSSMPNLSTSTEEFYAILGMTTNTNYLNTQGIFFLYDRNNTYPTGSGASVNGNWKAVTQSGAGAVTKTDTGVAVGTGKVKLRYVINAGGTSVAFYINDILVATNTTNIPTVPLSFKLWLVKTVGTTNRSVFIDFTRHIIALTTSR